MKSFFAPFYKILEVPQAARLFLLTGSALLLLQIPAFPQAPAISGFEPQKGHYGTIVTLSGTGFAAANEIKVAFGSVSAEVVEASDSKIKVKVPAGATYGPITVTNLSSGLTAFTSQPFLLSFGGQENGAVEFAPSVSFPGAGVFDVCTCDLDGDGKNDMVGSNENANSVTTYLNGSTIGSISFPLKKDLNLGNRSLYISCGDLDGDGKPELVYTGNSTEGNKVIILKNTSTIGTLSFAAPQILTVANKLLAKPAIHDLDGDGKAELILTDKAEDKVLVFKNTSTQGSISFDATPLLLPVSAASTQGLRITDINNDGLPDITASNFFGSKIFFFLNSSTPGSLSFSSPLEFEGTDLYNHAVQDLDGDEKPDLITLDYFANQVNIQLNKSSSTSISFSTAEAIATGAKPNGLELGDLNGDGKVDLLIGHNQSANPVLLLNTSSTSSLSFSTVTLSGSGLTANVQIGDMDGDAKPDIIAADKSNGIFYVFRNLSCIYPTIQPAGTVELCEGATLTLSTVQSPLAELASPELSYEWTKDGTATGNGHSLEVSSPGVYTVSTISADGCSATAEAVTVTSFAANLGDPVFDAVTNSCEGQPLALSVSPASEGATYTWTNAAGFEQSTASNSLIIEAADPALHGGVFTVSISKGECELSLQSEEVSIFPKPAVTISANGSLNLCSGESRVLSAEEGFTTYQWKKDGTSITEATGTTYTANETGSYTVVVKNSNGCEAESAATKLEVAAPLKAAFEGPAQACVDQPVQFTDQSTLAAGKAVSYLWDFGDGTQSAEASPTHTYTQAGSNSYTVTLRVQYENTYCSSTYSRPINVQQIPDISLEVLGATAFCAGDSVKVQVNGEAAEVSWSNGDVGLFTYAKESGTLEAEILTAGGCTLTKSIELTYLAAPDLQLRADKEVIKIGESVQLQASGGLTYSWEPAESLDVPTIANPLASPTKTTTYIVTTWGENGCFAIGEITIEVDFSFVVEVPKLFIPANDQSWKVTNIENYPEVSVLIMNKFGKTIFVATPYQNNWTGDQLQEGVYFYVFKDKAGKILKSGSITLIR